jgi:hypothetical protein
MQEIVRIPATSLRAGLTAQASLDPGRPGDLRLYPGRPVIPGDLVYMLVPDLVAATEFHPPSFGLALVLFGYAL